MFVIFVTSETAGKLAKYRKQISTVHAIQYTYVFSIFVGIKGLRSRRGAIITTELIVNRLFLLKDESTMTIRNSILITLGSRQVSVVNPMGFLISFQFCALASLK